MIASGHTHEILTIMKSESGDLLLSLEASSVVSICVCPAPTMCIKFRQLWPASAALSFLQFKTLP